MFINKRNVIQKKWSGYQEINNVKKKKNFFYVSYNRQSNSNIYYQFQIYINYKLDAFLDFANIETIMCITK